jgi:ACS family hexuronate transporter-like MFS transporter
VAQTELPADDITTPSVSGGPELSPAKADRWAWLVCWLMFFSTVLNYMDRQAIALVSTPIMTEFGLTNFDFGWVMAVFSLTYALCQVPAGYLVDRWDVRRTYAGAVAFWSLAGLSVTFSPVLTVLVVLRGLLGVGESFNWPCALRVTSRVLPPADRSLGNGIFNSGAAVGAVLTPLVVSPLARYFGWRTPFLVIGAAGFVWVAAWLVLTGGARADALAGGKPSTPADPYDFPKPAAGLSATARFAFAGVVLAAFGLAAAGYAFGVAAVPCFMFAIAWLMFGLLAAALALPLPALKGADWAESLGEIVRLPRFWVLVLVSVSINSCWHFLVGWMPRYLEVDRRMTFLASGLWSAVPFLAADVGNLGGGALSRFIARRGLSTDRARLAVMALCTLLITSGAWVGSVGSNSLVIALLGLMALGTAAFMANYFAFTQEVSSRHTGLIVGYLGGLGNLGAAGIVALAGLVKDRTGSFAPVFVLVGLVPFVGLGALLAGWGATGRGAETGSG